MAEWIPPTPLPPPPPCCLGGGGGRATPRDLRRLMPPAAFTAAFAAAAVLPANQATLPPSAPRASAALCLFCLGFPPAVRFFSAMHYADGAPAADKPNRRRCALICQRTLPRAQGTAAGTASAIAGGARGFFARPARERAQALGGRESLQRAAEAAETTAPPARTMHFIEAHDGSRAGGAADSGLSRHSIFPPAKMAFVFHPDPPPIYIVYRGGYDGNLPSVDGGLGEQKNITSHPRLKKNSPTTSTP